MKNRNEFCFSGKQQAAAELIVSERVDVQNQAYAAVAKNATAGKPLIF